MPGELDLALAAAAACPAPPLRSFARAGLPDPLVRALDRAGLSTPFAVQSAVLPDALAGRDVLARARTGSGKTFAFGLPTLARLHETDHQFRGAAQAGRLRAVVLVPTRELARQVADALMPMAAPLGLNVATVYGGAQIKRQIEKLRRGVDVLVATPGRLLDLMERGEARLGAVEVTILDEADYLADLGFMPALTKILDATPADAQRMLFSATLDRQVHHLVATYLTDPAIHAVDAPDESTVSLMIHQLFVLDDEQKVTVAAEIAVRPARTLFFVRTKAGADDLAAKLAAAGAQAAAIHSDLKQSQRIKVLEAFTGGTTRVLVATDVAARGLHIPDVDLVVHYDLPADHKDYLHRSGRTARAGAAGTVVTFAAPRRTRSANRIHELAAVSAERIHVHPGHHTVTALAASGTPIVPPLAPARSVERSTPDRWAPARRAGTTHRPDAERPRGSAAPTRGSTAPTRGSAAPARGSAAPARRSIARTHGSEGKPRQGSVEATQRPSGKKARWTAAEKAARVGNKPRGPVDMPAGPETGKARATDNRPARAGATNRAGRRAHLQPR